MQRGREGGRKGAKPWPFQDILDGQVRAILEGGARDENLAQHRLQASRVEYGAWIIKHGQTSLRSEWSTLLKALTLIAADYLTLLFPTPGANAVLC